MLRIAQVQPDAIPIYHGENELAWSRVPSLETSLVYGRGESVGPVSRLSRLTDRIYVVAEYRIDWCPFAAKGEDWMVELWFATTERAGSFSVAR